MDLKGNKRHKLHFGGGYSETNPFPVLKVGLLNVSEQVGTAQKSLQNYGTKSGGSGRSLAHILTFSLGFDPLTAWRPTPQSHAVA